MSQDEIRVWSISSGTPFLRTLAEAILAGGFPTADLPPPGPADLPGYTILVPTRRAAGELADAFLQVSGGEALMLPRIRPLGDVDEDELLLAPGEFDAGLQLDIPPAISPLRRQLLLAGLLMEWARNNPHVQFSRALLPGPSQAIDVAAGLGRMIDQLETEQVGMDRFEALVTDNFAAYWQDVLNVLEIVRKRLPIELERLGKIGPAERRSRLMMAEAERLAVLKPEAPFIAAGSTGSIPATANLLRTVSGLPNGAVILPGLDTNLDDASWDVLDAQHPQYGLRELLRELKVLRNDVRPLGPGQPVSHARTALFSEVMRPSETTELWQHRLPKLVDDAGVSLENFSIARAPARREEALAIALEMRRTLEVPGQTAALITHDRDLGRQVSAQLKRWQLDVDDSAGVPLSRTVPGILIHLILDAVETGFSPASLAALFAHPLVLFGLPAGEASRAGRKLELAVLRGIAPSAGLDNLCAALEHRKAEVLQKPHRHPHLAHWKRSDWELAEQAAGLVGPAFEHLVSIDVAAWPMRLDVAVETLIRVAEALASDKTGNAEGLWSGNAGEQLSQFFASLMETAAESPPLAPADFGRVVMSLMAQPVVRPRFGTHPRLSILGLLEARLTAHDVVILGGLNEKRWPAQTETDPWLNRPMRVMLGLPSPERRMGLSAHDFVQAVCAAGRVVITFAEKVDNAPAVPSRWLLRLTAVLQALGAQDPETPGRELVGQAIGLDLGIGVSPSVRPAPAPALHLRPTRLSVTEIETWLRDPYAIYARHILKLKPLEDPGLAPGPRERGNLFHEIFERFSRQFLSKLPDDVPEALIAIGEEEFAIWRDYPEVAAFWWPRFVRVADAAAEIENGFRENAESIHVEDHGKLTIPIAGTEGFQLTGRADRIDILRDGSARIIDYKTGAPPGLIEVFSGKSPQLLLEAIILLKEGFKGLNADGISDLSYVQLTGGEPPIAIRKLDPGTARPKIDATAEDICWKNFHRLERFIVRFLTDPTHTYLPRVLAKYEDRPMAYDHLSRYREWASQQSGTKPS